MEHLGSILFVIIVFAGGFAVGAAFATQLLIYMIEEKHRLPRVLRERKDKLLDLLEKEAKGGDDVRVAPGP